MSPTVFEDDASIPDGEVLFRRISLVHLVEDEDTGLARVSSGAFNHREMSVNLASKLAEDGGQPDQILASYPGHRLVALRAGDARSAKQAICRDPLPEDLSHGLVFGPKNKKTSEQLRKLAAWIIPAEPPQYALVAAERIAAGLS